MTAGIALALTGCVTSPHAGAPGPPPVSAQTPSISGPGVGGRGPGPTGGRFPATSDGGSPEDAAHSGANGDWPIGAGDLIEVSVFEVEELSKIRLRVPSRGWVSLPLLGQIEAAGRTTAQLEDDIRDRLERRFMHNPQVSVFIHEHHSQRVSVIGAVRRGGVFPLNRQLRLADALALAEGVTEEADPVIYVVRRLPAGTVAKTASTEAKTAGTEAGLTDRAPLAGEATEEVMTPIDLSALADGREDLNIPLRSGDVVHVPRAGSFYVGGSVEHPGSFLLRGKTTVQQAILAAGGLKEVADWSDVRLYRKAASGQMEVFTYDLKAFEDGQPAPELRRNDVVVVGKHLGKALFYGFIDFFKGALGVAKGI
jgi:polysaccharide export outer membrane protein